MSHVGYPSGGRGRGGSIKGESRRDFLPTQNAFTKKVSDDIELFNTETLVQEVEKVFALNHPDPHELEKAKRMLKVRHAYIVLCVYPSFLAACEFTKWTTFCTIKEHEQALVEAIEGLQMHLMVKVVTSNSCMAKQWMGIEVERKNLAENFNDDQRKGSWLNC
ncbi:hypothetical protein MANES_08G046100v8 [Manihot esculenta]|uniref:Uncharacterized protein n=1 Tax=Manihot esculenta TaxID=3983 RepID=A0ACB7HAL6_MANES|nr:hypothetical protein MANES_08G046100v8 [Manihot esculenta]